MERLCFTNDQRLRLRGLCIPDEPLARNSRILVIMEKLNQQKLECPEAEVQQRYHLTEREQMIITYLMVGLTNKEIANRLNLSEYTVKEHFKRIMHKTKTTNRTGLLARIIFPISQDTVPGVLSDTM
jgi:DNA-binding CsgD family transcriptional regulator